TRCLSDWSSDVCSSDLLFRKSSCCGCIMFSRKNVMQPQQLDLREVVANMTKMLQRLLGETIVLEFQPPPEIPLVQADVGMSEQEIGRAAGRERGEKPGG